MTDKQKSDILDGMIVVCDTREQKNQHILDWFKLNKIPYIIRKLDTADYTVEFKNNPELNGIVLVERKNSLDEIIGNFTTNRERFINEFERLKDEDICHIVIEGSTWTQVINGTYRSKLPSNSLVANLMTWTHRYNVGLWLVKKSESPYVIYNLLKYGVREKLNYI
jgi:ERCC4-type nuclease